MKFNKRSPLIAIGVSGAMVAGMLGLAGVAMAQSTDDATPTPSSETQPLRGERGAHHGGHHGLVGLMSIVRASGLDASVFREGFEAGQTPAEILEANGVDPAEVTSTILSALEEKLATAVENGRLTQERADELLAKAREKLATLMNTVPDLDARPERPTPFLNVAEFLEIERAALMESLRDGMTLAEIAGANGSSGEALIEHLLAEANEHIDQALADGKIDEERAAEFRTRAEERIPEIVNNTGERIPGEGRPHRRGGHGRFFDGKFRDRGAAPAEADGASSGVESATGVA